MALLIPKLHEDKKLSAVEKLFVEIFNDLLQKAPLTQVYTRIDYLPEEALDLLAHQFHIEGYDLAQSVEEKRNLIKSAIELHKYKGTKYAIKKVLEALGLEGQVKEWFEYQGQPFNFRVELGITNREITTELRDKLIKLIEDYKNERSWLEEIILYYLARTKLQINLGSAGELQATAQSIDGFEWTAQKNPQIYTGSIGEAVAWAQ